MAPAATAPTSTTLPPPTTAAPTAFHLKPGTAIEVGALVPQAYGGSGDSLGKAKIRVQVGDMETWRGDSFDQPERGTYLAVRVRLTALADNEIPPTFYLLAGGEHLNNTGTDHWTPVYEQGPFNLDMLNKGEHKGGWLVFDAPRVGKRELILLDSTTQAKQASWDLPRD